jgi:hypothetical protein
MAVGYARVSEEQHLAALFRETARGRVRADLQGEVKQDKGARPELRAPLDYVREGEGGLQARYGRFLHGGIGIRDKKKKVVGQVVRRNKKALTRFCKCLNYLERETGFEGLHR